MCNEDKRDPETTVYKEYAVEIVLTCNSAASRVISHTHFLPLVQAHQQSSRRSKEIMHLL